MKNWVRATPVILLLALAAPAAAEPTITEFPIPFDATTEDPPMPEGIVMGPDGKIWFTEQKGQKIGRLDPANPSAIQEFDLPTGLTDPIYITVGPDNKIWFTGKVSNAGGVGRMNPANPTDTQSHGGYGVAGDPKGIAVGSDGNIYVGDSALGRVVTIDPTTMDAIPDGDTELNGGNFNVRSLTLGPDANIWVTDFGGQIGRVTPAGSAVTFNVPATTTWDITTGSDGALWYTSPDGASAVAGRLTTAGVVTNEFPVTPTGDPHGIAAGPDGALWIAQAVSNSIGHLATDGQFNEIKGLTAGARPEWIASGPNNTMWFSEQDGNAIGRISGIDVGGGGPGGGNPPPDTTAPDVTRFRITRKRFRAGGLGTIIKFTLSEDARVTISFERRVKGRWRRVRRKMRFESTAGNVKLRFRGRFDIKHPLKPGRYRMTLTAADAAGNVSSPDRVRFVLLRKRR